MMSAKYKSRFSPFAEDCDYDDYDPYNDNTYITCYPGAENTYREPWVDPELFSAAESYELSSSAGEADMEPIYYAGEKPVYRFCDMRVVADGEGESDSDRVLVYQREHLIAEFPTQSIVVLSHYSGGYFLYADSNRCQFEFVFEDSAKALEACNTFCRLGII